jgi:16S rRNA processing protein RimM
MPMAGSRPASMNNAGTGPVAPGAAAAPAVPPAMPQDAVEVGRVAGAWGVKGGIKVKPFAAAPQALFSTKRWYLQAPEPVGAAGAKRRERAAAAASPDAWPVLLRIVTAREQGDGVVATAQDLEDRDAAEALAGARVFVPRSSFPTPAADEYYWVDLIGLEVRNREGVVLGAVAGLLETGPVCVLRVRPADAAGVAAAATGGAGPAEVLIPFVSAYVDRVDMPARCVHVDWQPDY